MKILIIEGMTLSEACEAIVAQFRANEAPIDDMAAPQVGYARFKAPESKLVCDTCDVAPTVKVSDTAEAGDRCPRFYPVLAREPMGQNARCTGHLVALAPHSDDVRAEQVEVALSGADNSANSEALTRVRNADEAKSDEADAKGSEVLTCKHCGKPIEPTIFGLYVHINDSDFDACPNQRKPYPVGGKVEVGRVRLQQEVEELKGELASMTANRDQWRRIRDIKAAELTQVKTQLETERRNSENLRRELDGAQKYIADTGGYWRQLHDTLNLLHRRMYQVNLGDTFGHFQIDLTEKDAARIESALNSPVLFEKFQFSGKPAEATEPQTISEGDAVEAIADIDLAPDGIIRSGTIGTVSMVRDRGCYVLFGEIAAWIPPKKLRRRDKPSAESKPLLCRHCQKPIVVSGLSKSGYAHAENGGTLACGHLPTPLGYVHPYDEADSYSETGQP